MYHQTTQIPHTNHDHHHRHRQRQIHWTATQNDRRNFNNHDEEDQTLQFRPTNHHPTVESDDSGVCSPPLWKNSPTSQPLLHHNSRAQAIIRGQYELMEMVKNMPESSYELSLKDLVEHHPKIIETEEKSVDFNHKQNLEQRRVVKEKKSNMTRSESFEAKGVFLNTGFPFFGLKWKKKNTKKKGGGGGGSSSGRVSPKPEGLMKGERDWWKKKKFTGSSDSESSKFSNTSGATTSSGGGGSSSGRSNSGGGRKKKGFLSRGCWSCFNSRSRKSVD